MKNYTAPKADFISMSSMEAIATSGCTWMNSLESIGSHVDDSGVLMTGCSYTGNIVRVPGPNLG